MKSRMLCICVMLGLVAGVAIGCSNNSPGVGNNDGGTDTDADGDTDTDTDADSDTDTDSDSDTDTDTDADAGPDGGDSLPSYLISVDYQASPTRLIKIDVFTGAGQVLCELPIAYDTYTYNSSTFSRDGFLFMSNSSLGRLDMIDPCTCAVTEVGLTGYASLPGITADYGNGLFGVETTVDVLLSLDTNTGAGTEIGPLGVDFGTSGATWSDDLNLGTGGLYGINGSDDYLYTIDYTTGAATQLVLMDTDFASVGIELLPANGEIYACTSSNNAVLRQIDPTTGTVTEIGSGMGHFNNHCDNLAAPWIVVECLED